MIEYSKMKRFKLTAIFFTLSVLEYDIYGIEQLFGDTRKEPPDYKIRLNNYLNKATLTINNINEKIKEVKIKKILLGELKNKNNQQDEKKVIYNQLTEIKNQLIILKQELVEEYNNLYCLEADCDIFLSEPESKQKMTEELFGKKDLNLSFLIEVFQKTEEEYKKFTSSHKSHELIGKKIIILEKVGEEKIRIAEKELEAILMECEKEIKIKNL
jgi:hypothetical protein